MPWSMINKWLKFNTVCVSVCLFHHVRHNLLCSLNSILIRQLREGQCICVRVCVCLREITVSTSYAMTTLLTSFLLQRKAYPAYTLVLFCTKEINIHSECSSWKRGKKITNEKKRHSSNLCFHHHLIPVAVRTSFLLCPVSCVCVLALLSIVLFNTFVKWLTFSFSSPSLGLDKAKTQNIMCALLF